METSNFYYKGKPYKVLMESKVKIEGVWYPCVIYLCLYDNPDGMIWVRPKESFYQLFTKDEPEQTVRDNREIAGS